MSARRLLALLAALPWLGGCTVDTGFKGPGWDGRTVTADVPGPHLVALTQATVKPGAKRAFMRHVRAVEASLAGQPGLIGYSMRTQLLGREAWTMTVWRDAASLKAFVRSPAHRDAMTLGRDMVETMRFAEVERNRVPLAWDEAAAILKREGYAYR